MQYYLVRPATITATVPFRWMFDDGGTEMVADICRFAPSSSLPSDLGAVRTLLGPVVTSILFDIFYIIAPLFTMTHVQQKEFRRS